MNSNAVRQYLDRLIQQRGEDYASVSRLIGRNQTYIQQFIKRGIPRRLQEEDRRRLAVHFGIAETLLGAPASVHPVQEAPSLPGEGVRADERLKNYFSVQSYDVGASAGHGTIAENVSATAPMIFHGDFIRQIASGRAEALSSIRVQGDSMLPTLSDGDSIIVDSDDAGARLRDGIYVLRAEDTLLVKRIAVHPATHRIDILSDNPAYSGWRDCNPDDVSIIGRVVWVGRYLR